MSAGFTRAHLAILATALLFSTGGAAIKACGLTAWQVASFRSGVAALALALLVPASRRVSGRVLLVAVAYAGTLVSFVLANKLTTGAQAVFLQAAAPLYVVFLERWLLGTRMARRDVPILAAVAVGVGLLFFGSGGASATAPDPARGNIIAIVSGVFYAFLMVGLRWLAADATAPQGTAAAATLWGNVLAFAAALPLALPVVGLAAGRLGGHRLPGRVPDRARLLPDDPGDAHPHRARHRAAAAHRTAAQPDVRVAGARRDADPAGAARRRAGARRHHLAQPDHAGRRRPHRPPRSSKTPDKEITP